MQRKRTHASRQRVGSCWQQNSSRLRVVLKKVAIDPSSTYLGLKFETMLKERRRVPPETRNRGTAKNFQQLELYYCLLPLLLCPCCIGVCTPQTNWCNAAYCCCGLRTSSIFTVLLNCCCVCAVTTADILSARRRLELHPSTRRLRAADIYPSTLCNA